MTPPVLPLAEVVTFLMILMRVGAILVMMPIFGERVVPAQVKAALSVVIAVLVYPVLNVPLTQVPTDSTVQLLLAMGGEILIGIVIGFVSRIVFAAVQTAGELMGFQMGVAIANVIDPVSSTQVSILSEFLYLMALLIFVTVDGHHIFLAAITESYRTIPALGGIFGSHAVREMVLLTRDVFVTGLRLSAPVVAVVFFVNVSLGLIARTVPQINVFIVGFPVQVFAGLLFLGLAMPFIVALIAGEIGDVWGEVRRLLVLMTA